MGAQPHPTVLVMASTFPRFPGDTLPAFVLRLCQFLQREGVESLVLAPHAPGLARRERLEGVDCRRFRYAPAALERLAYGGGMLANIKASPWLWAVLPGFLLAMFLQALWLLRRHRLRVLHAHWVVPQGLVAAMLRCLLGSRLRLVITAHGSDLQADMGGLVHRLRVWAMRQADVLAVVSEGLRERALALGIPPERVVVAPMGVDTRCFRPPRVAVRRDLLFVGRLVEGKGCAHLIAAFSLLAPKYPGLCLRLVGDGPERAPLERQVADLGLATRVVFSGALPAPSVADAMREAVLLVMPSLQEGLGLVAAEALACACPVVASGIAGIRDVVRDGRTGLLVPPGDAPALAAAIAGLLTDPARAAALADAGLADVEARFAWPSVARGYRELYGGSV